MRERWRMTCEALFISAMTLTAMAQDATAGKAGGFAATIGSESTQRVLYGLAGVLAAVVIGMALTFLYYGTRRLPEMEGIVFEPVVGSRYEQLLSEIQGLTLRVQGGESKGYYPKIERLARIFLERIGPAGARDLPDAEIEALLASGEIPQDVATALRSVFQRCKQGAIHESEKLDFTATDLLKDLRTIIKRVEQGNRS
jgi:hypothetical protein